MKKIFFAFLCVSLLAALARLGSAQAHEQTEISRDALLGGVRAMNTFEFMYSAQNGRFASREELLAFLQQKGILGKLKLNLQDPKPYELAVTTSQDGKHYQIGLKRPNDPNEKSKGCSPAIFSDDAGVIFIGSALGCDSSTR
jgi:hypothetical protein